MDRARAPVAKRAHGSSVRCWLSPARAAANCRRSPTRSRRTRRAAAPLRRGRSPRCSGSSWASCAGRRGVGRLSPLPEPLHVVGIASRHRADALTRFASSRHRSDDGMETMVQRLKRTLARVSDGGGGARRLHDLRGRSSPALLYHPSSPLSHVVTNPLVRRLLTGILMGTTAILLVHSPWGRQSGAHMNPSFTLTFLRLGKIAPWDALFYVAGQFAGAVLGLVVAGLLIGSVLTSPEVNFVATQPGARGTSRGVRRRARDLVRADADGADHVEHRRLARLTPYLGRHAGRDLHHARSTALGHEHESRHGRSVRRSWGTSGTRSGSTSPRRRSGCCSRQNSTSASRAARSVWCAKLLHLHGRRCIFNCEYPMPAGDADRRAPAAAWTEEER